MNYLKMKYCLMAVLLMLSVSASVAQSNTLVGNWLVDVEKSIDRMPLAMKENYNSLDTAGQTRVRNVMSGRVFIFQEEGLIEVSWIAGGQTQESSGTWTLNVEETIVAITIDGSTKEFEYSFELDGLQLRNRQGGGLFNTLYFTRQ